MPYVTTFERDAKMEGLRTGIEACLEIRYGPAGLQLMPEIRQLTEVKALEAILAKLKTAVALDEVRQLLAVSVQPGQQGS